MRMVLPAEFEHETTETWSSVTSPWLTCLMVSPSPGARNRMDTLPIQISVRANSKAAVRGVLDPCWTAFCVGDVTAEVILLQTVTLHESVLMQSYLRLCTPRVVLLWLYHDPLPARILLSPPWKRIGGMELREEDKRNRETTWIEEAETWRKKLIIVQEIIEGTKMGRKRGETEQVYLSRSASGLHLGGAVFESRPLHKLSWLRWLRQMPRAHFRLSHDRLIRHFFQSSYHFVFNCLRCWWLR
jgi:hypothetical protein